MKTSSSKLKMFHERKSSPESELKKPANSQEQRSNRRSLFSVLFNSSSSSKSPSEPNRMSSPTPQVPDADNADNADQQANNNNQEPSQEEEELAREARSPKKPEEDVDSYVLDLNDCVANERFKSLVDSTINHKQKVSSSSSPVSPNNWHENQNYVSQRDQKVRLRDNQNRFQGAKSPMVEQFIEKHKLHFSSGDSTSGEEDQEDAVPPSRPDKKWSASSAPRPNFTVVRKNSREISIVRREEDEEDSDFRLNKWRLQASKSSRPNELDSSDLEDELNSRTPALALTCSDDTSCSSVELIWAPRGGVKNQPQKMVGRATTLEQKGLKPSSLSIFELAKPRRAKGKRFGQRAAGKRDKSSPEKQWVENPIFTTTDDEDDKSEEKSHKDEAGTETLSLSSLSRSVSLSLFSSTDQEGEEEAGETNARLELAPKPLSESPLNSSKHRWSLMNRRKRRRKSREEPINRQEDVFLNYILDLDKRIKTNASSIKSQLSLKLSDTSKRASLLADQLITSVKDATKEQLLFASNHRRKHLREKHKISDKESQGDPKPSETNRDKSQLYSLIYLHQQHPNGQQVIIRQPTTICSKDIDQITSIIEESALPPPKPPRPPSPKRTVDKKEAQSGSVEPDSQLDTLEPSQPTSQETKEESTSSSHIELYVSATSMADAEPAVNEPGLIEAPRTDSKSDGARLSDDLNTKARFEMQNSSILNTRSTHESDSPLPPKRKSIRKKFRRQINVAMTSDDDEEDQFYHREYMKLRRDLDDKVSASERRFNQMKLRSLNYWTRFRMRKLGLHWQLKPIERSKSIDF